MKEEQAHVERNGQLETRARGTEVDGEIETSQGYEAYPGVTLLDERDRQRQQLWKELQEVEREIMASNGYQVRSNLGLLKKSYFIFDTNYLMLRQALDEFEQPMVFSKLWEEKESKRLDMFMSDVVRLFHNYTAGAATLLSHIRTLQDNVIQGTHLSQEYQVREEQHLRSAPLPRFVEDLGNYMFHQELPFALAELNFGNQGNNIHVDSAIKLEVGKLGKWEQWSEKGREYLNMLDHKVKLYEIAEGHKAIVDNFYQWYVMRQSELHKEAFEELEELTDKRIHLQRKIMHLEDLLETAEQITIAAREEQEKRAMELEAERRMREQEKARADTLEGELDKARRSWWRRG